MRKVYWGIAVLLELMGNHCCRQWVEAGKAESPAQRAFRHKHTNVREPKGRVADKCSERTKLIQNNPPNLHSRQLFF